MAERTKYKTRLVFAACALFGLYTTWNDLPEEGRVQAVSFWSNFTQRPGILYDRILLLENPWQVVRLPLLAIACAALSRFFRKRVEKDAAAKEAAEGGGAAGKRNNRKAKAA